MRQIRPVWILTLALLLNLPAAELCARDLGITEEAQDLRRNAGDRRLAGDLSAASVILQRAVELEERREGAGGRGMVELLLDLAVCRAELGETVAARGLIERAHWIERTWLDTLLPSQAEEEALAVVSESSRTPHLAVSLALTAPEDQDLVRWAWTIAARSRGQVLEVMVRRMRIAAALRRLEMSADRGEDVASVRETMKRLSEVQSRISAHLLQNPRATEASGKIRFEELLSEKLQSEKALARRLDLHRVAEESSEFDPTQAAAELNEAALVSFLKADLVSLRSPVEGEARPAEEPEQSYVAFGLDSSGRAFVRRLGPVAEIDALAGRWRTATLDGVYSQEPGFGYADADYYAAASRLRSAVWDPVAAVTKDASLVYVIPDGLLHFVSLAALPADRDRFLVEDGPAFVYLSSERELGRRPVRLRRNRGLLAVADPEFSSAAQGRDPAGIEAGGGSRANRFPQLPGTAREVNALASIWAERRPSEELVVLRGGEANKSELQKLANRFRVVHLATHGFFSGGESAGASRSVQGAMDRNPLSSSGIALAGANGAGAAGPDGILSAGEIATLDLSGVELVVVSACESAMGQLREAEGVFGLKRGFQIAGAGQLLLTLWPVEDQAAEEWMTAFYRNYFEEDEDPGRALQRTSQQILNLRREQGRSTHPFFWSPFVVAGRHAPAPLAHFQMDSVNVVVADVVVTDRRNRIVNKLTAEDFEIYENDTPQRIENFLSATKRIYGRAPNPMVFLIDYAGMPPGAWKQFGPSLEKHVQESLTEQDYAGLFVLGNRLEMLSDLSNDPERILNAIRELQQRTPGVLSGSLDAKADVVSNPLDSFGPTMNMDAMDPVGTEFELFRRWLASPRTNPAYDPMDRLLGAVQRLTRYFADIPGRKTLIVLSGAFQLEQRSGEKLRQTIQLANHASVSVYGVNVEGLEPGLLEGTLKPRAPAGGVGGGFRDELERPLGTTQTTTRNITSREGRRVDAHGGRSLFDQTHDSRHAVSETGFETLCQQTGGFLVRNTNDISRALARIDADIRSHYLISYLPQNQRLDGTYRSIRVEVKDDKYNVRHRSGYLAASDDLVILSEAELQALEGAKTGALDLTLPANVGISAFPANGMAPNVAMTIELPPGAVSLESRNDEYRALLNVIGLVRDMTGRVALRVGSPMHLQIPKEEAEEIRRSGLSVSGEIALDPGKYQLEFLILDHLAQKGAKVAKSLSIEPPGEELYLSSIVMARSVAPSEGEGLLHADGVRFTPSATARFKNGDQLAFFFRIYNLSESGQEQIGRVSIWIEKTGGGARHPVSDDVLPAPDSSGVASASKWVHLQGVPPGNYFLNAQVTDLVSGKSKLRRALFIVEE